MKERPHRVNFWVFSPGKNSFLNQCLNFRVSKPNSKPILIRSVDDSCNCKGNIILNSFNFVTKILIVWLAIDYIIIVKTRVNKCFIFCNKIMPWKSFTKFFNDTYSLHCFEYLCPKMTTGVY